MTKQNQKTLISYIIAFVICTMVCYLIFTKMDNDPEQAILKAAIFSFAATGVGFVRAISKNKKKE